MGLNIRQASVVYPSVDGRPPVEALRQIDLAIENDDFVVALGASGCGKSTLLSLIAGFLSPSSGEILLDGQPVQGPGADRAVVFQKHALMPWLNVIDNVAFGLKLQGVAESAALCNRAEIHQPSGAGRVRDLAGLQPVGRHAAARRHRPGADLRPEGPADGRTPWRAGRADPGKGAGTDPERSGTPPTSRCSSSPIPSKRRCSWAPG
jgi:ABC-type sugar transport system ATPase subunit